MQAQTVFRAGNSGVVAIPSELQKETGIKTGTKVYVEKTDENDIIIKKTTKKSENAVSSSLEFKNWWKEFLKENSDILDELALR
jgi:antitoxin component of MazEF toxin-antitoxin module